MDVTGLTSYIDKTYTNAANNASASKAKDAIGGISKDSTDEELVEAVKGFETYFVEQVVKNMKESMIPKNKDEDATMSQYKDYFMDSTISTLAREIVDQAGDHITDQFVQQIKRNFGMDKIPEETVEDTEKDPEEISEIAESEGIITE